MLCKISVDDDPCSSSSLHYSVMGIYGFAGCGKTTLAQYVCNDDRVSRHFTKIIWINVPQTFDIGRIYMEMLEAATGMPSSEFSNLDTLQRKLELVLKDQLILLVLDDIWTYKNVREEELKRLLSPLKFGKRGSKVLITTRFKEAAISFGAQIMIPVLDMGEKEFYNLFMHYALGSANLDDRELEEFQKIGREIMINLKGSPLTATVVVAQLRKELNVYFWRRVAEENLFSGTMEPLWWSYQHLDEKVRRCFAYCSIFPRRLQIKRDVLVNLWISEGFINTTSAGEDLEFIGQKYLDELVACSFLKRGNNEMFYMHDLLHELAVMVAGGDCLQLEESDTKDISSDVRHLYVDMSDPMKAVQVIGKLKKLRTLIINPNGKGLTEDALHCIFMKLRNLRVLKVKIEGNGGIPDSVCNLWHLRYLGIYKSKQVLIDLPKKFGKLYHLLVLEFHRPLVVSCSSVKCMKNLISLRHICSSLGPPRSPVKHSFHFPGIGNLHALRTLGHFCVKKEDGCELQELKNLNNLHAGLKISGLENVDTKDKAMEAMLVNKKYLSELSLVWTDNHKCPMDLQVDILEGLQPPSLLVKLKIAHYYGLNCPSWFSAQNSLRNLKSLKLEFCLEVEFLPDFRDHLVHLCVLALRTLPKLKRLPQLPETLKSLEIVSCESLVLTCVEDVELLRSVFIELVFPIVPWLKDKDPIEFCKFADQEPVKCKHALRNIIDSFGELEHQSIRPGMLSIIIPLIFGWTEASYCELPQLSSLKELTISGCIITDSVLNNWLKVSRFLHKLKLDRIPFFTRISSDVIKILTKLRVLGRYQCIHFTAIEGINESKVLETLKLAIIGCPRLFTLRGDEKIRLLGSLQIDDLFNVSKILSVEACSSLKFLEVEGLEELGNEDILLRFSSLTTLWFQKCNINILPGNLIRLASLSTLVLNDCKNISSIPPLPPGLQTFIACGCNQLFVESCNKNGEPNFQMLADIPVRIVKIESYRGS